MPAFWNEETSGVQWLLAMRAFEEIRVSRADIGEDSSKQDEEFALMKEQVNFMLSKIGDGVV